jgi:nitrogen fixation NifU-like protein
LAQAQEISDSFMGLMQSKGTQTGDENLLEDAVALAGVSQYPARIKCALLGWMAFKDASVQALAKNK